MPLEIYDALAKAQAEFPTIHRDKEVTVKTKAGYNYTFAYAPLETILGAVMPALTKNSLSITQSVVSSPDGKWIESQLHHSASERPISAAVPILYSPEAGAQALGSAITYARRYSLTLLLCIATEDDDDVNLAEGNEATVRRTNVPAARVESTLAEALANRLRALLNSNAEEAVYKVHLEVRSQYELYADAAGKLSPADRRIIKEIVAKYSKLEPANG